MLALNRLDTAAIAGITPQTLDRWVRGLGCPRNEDGTFSAPEVVQWLLERERQQVQSSDDASEREAIAKADIAEIKRDQLLESLIPVDVVAEMLDELASEGRRVGKAIGAISPESQRKLIGWLEMIEERASESV